MYCARLPTPRSRCLGAARGFTLIELMVVVIIIAVLAVLAIPTITQRLRDRRTQQYAHGISQTYRVARMRAMGRGSAVLVRYVGTATPQFEVREAIEGAAATMAGCAPQPARSCGLTSWVDAVADNQVVDALAPTATVWESGEITGVEVRDGGVVRPMMDVCFTPMGRAFMRYTSAQGAPFAPLVSVPTVNVFRALSASPSTPSGFGITRQVFLLPNGTARLGV